MSGGRIAFIWSMIFVVDASRYLIGIGALSWILYRRLGSWSRTRRIQSRRPRSADVRREVACSLLTSAVFATVGVATILAYRFGVVDQPWRPDRYGPLYALAALPVLLVLHDAYFYWAHRAMHRPWLYRSFHRIHHLSRTPTAWAAYSFAPGEALVMGSFVPIAAYLMPVPQTTLFFFMLIMVVRNGMGHCGVEFHPRWWIDTPLDALTTTTHHDLHHQRVRGNYGLYFTWWDRWMGTEASDYREQFRRAAGARREVPVAESASDARGRASAG